MSATITFRDTILAVHIAAVVVGFGVIFSLPLVFSVGTRLDPRSLPLLYRIERAITSRIVQPSLAVVLAAGIYLASDEHMWKRFYVQWGVGVVIVLGALAGALIAPAERRLAELAEQDIAAAPGGSVSRSPEHQALSRRLVALGALSGALVLLTIFFMANHVGAPSS